VLTGEALKVAGQEQSLLDVLDETEGRFLHVIDQVSAGTLFSVNLVRSRLDELGVPDKARAALFKQAVAARLIVPVFTPTPMGTQQQVTEPSTGLSAHHAHVRVYARTEVNLRGGP
jgi:hypothetical protein